MCKTRGRRQVRRNLTNGHTQMLMASYVEIIFKLVSRADLANIAYKYMLKIFQTSLVRLQPLHLLFCLLKLQPITIIPVSQTGY
jgi:hypothetical protein